MPDRASGDLLSAGLGTPQMLLEHMGRDHEGLGHECQARADSRSKPVDPYRQAKLALGRKLSEITE